MATIMCLPDEIIAIVLGYDDISSEDIMNFRCMWEQFPSPVKYDIDWERIFSKRWPSAKKHYDKQSKENEQKNSEENEQKDKESLNFIETGIKCMRQLRDYVSQIIYKHYDKISFDNFHDMLSRTSSLWIYKNKVYLDEDLINNFDKIIYKPENFITYSFFIDEIKNLLTQSPRRTGCDLTERYCITKLSHYMRQRSLIMEWDRFEKQPDRELLLERTATFVAQAIQPQKDVFYSCVKASLDSIAREVLKCLRKKHPDHSIFSTSAETFSHWKNYNIDDNHWDAVEGMQIMDILDEYIFGTLKFRLSVSQNTNSEYMCIDNVLKKKFGQEIILLIIYHSVARRLGLRCDVIRYRPRFYYQTKYCIFWKPEYARNSLENARCFNISFEKFPDCLVNQMSWFRTTSSRSTFPITAIQTLGGIKRTLPDLRLVYNGVTDEFNYSKCNIDCTYWICFQKGEKLITRPKDVKYAVGMIVTHGDQTTDSCAGVIVGWFQNIGPEEGIFPMSLNDIEGPFTCIDICKLPWNHYDDFYFERGQTYYTILTENNKMCFVEEDAITLTTPKWIDNIEIGRYFCKFEGTHYVPNKMLARLYPQDAAITAQTTRSEN